MVNPVDEMSQRAQHALEESPYCALRRLHVNRIEGQLLISGRVSTFYHKQQAQEIVRAVCGDLRVVNSVEVETAETR